MSSNTDLAGAVPASNAAALVSAPSLLWQLEKPVTYEPWETESSQESRLVRARLGLGSSLFTALRCKHAPTAEHCLRVALGCSAWTVHAGVPSPQNENLEVAALLHDIGKIGVPDHVLLKPGQLTSPETEAVRKHRSMGLEILKSFGASPSIVNIIRYAPSWYHPQEPTEGPQGEDLPLGARMLGIVDAFDSMTRDQVYRPAMSRSDAFEVLVDHAGTQFDPLLVKQFYELQQCEQSDLHAAVARRWLRKLMPDAVGGALGPTAPGFPGAAETLAPLFLDKLIDSMHDAVIFVDADLVIQLWNRGAERLTGKSASDVQQAKWHAHLLNMCDEQGRTVTDKDCPVQKGVESGVQGLRRLEVRGTDGPSAVVDMHVVPVVDGQGHVRGANILMHDVSSEATLEERCQSLHEKATRDQLTGIANRAEFDRQHQTFIDEHIERGQPCSLIICDIDHFKRVNDTYGHQAGDEALQVFAKLLAKKSRPEDLVARYGGEEFVVLCADCDLPSANKRAEEIRQTLERMPLKMLNGRYISASFGVTESSAEDTDADMLRRADRGLLEAKAQGRNHVVEVRPDGNSVDMQCERGWFSWWKPAAFRPCLKTELLADVPIKILAEKLRGFVVEYHVDVKPLDCYRTLLRVEPERSGMFRRDSDRPVAFLMELTFAEEAITEDENNSKRVGQVLTRINVAVQPRRDRDRRRGDLMDRSRQLIQFLQSYLMAADAVSDDGTKRAVRRERSLAGTWLEP